MDNHYGYIDIDRFNAQYKIIYLAFFESVFRKCSDVALLADLSVGNICHQFGTFTSELLLYWLFQWLSILDFYFLYAIAAIILVFFRIFSNRAGNSL